MEPNFVREIVKKKREKEPRNFFSTPPQPPSCFTKSILRRSHSHSVTDVEQSIKKGQERRRSHYLNVKQIRNREPYLRYSSGARYIFCLDAVVITFH